MNRNVIQSWWIEPDFNVLRVTIQDEYMLYTWRVPIIHDGQAADIREKVLSMVSKKGVIIDSTIEPKT